jgi:PAS domain S-box-containing protein
VKKHQYLLYLFGEDPLKPDQKEDVKNYAVLGIVLLSFFITEITIYYLSEGTIFVLSHFFYFPVILAAMLYPRRGILIATGFALMYVALIYLLDGSGIQNLISATMQFYVFVSVGIVISWLTLSLRENEQRYRELSDLLPESIFEIDIEGRFRFTNRGGLEKFGYTTEDFERGVHMTSVIVPEEHDRLNEAIRQCLQNRMARSYEFTGRSKSGERFPLEVYPGLIETDHRITGIRGIAVDVSEKKKAERELRWKNKQLSVINEIIRTVTSPGTVAENLGYALERILSLLHFDTGAIYLIDEQGTTAQLKAVKVSGGDERDTFLGKMQAIDLSHPSFRQLFTAEEPRYIEYGSDSGPREHDGIFPVQGILSFAALPLIGEDRTLGAVFLATRKDHRFSEEEREMLESLGRELGNAILCNILQERLKASNEEANLYLDIMTHDLNNMATVTQGYAEMIREIGDEDIGGLTDKLLTSVRQEIEIISTVSTIRRIHERGRSLKPIRLNQVIENQIRIFSDVNISYSPNGAVVLGDDLVSEIFTNLIGNSRKFGGEGVNITVRIENAGYDYVISIEDDGPGIPDAMKSRLFSRFQPGATTKSGTGLGLSICRMLVEQYGGRIWVEDRVPGDPESGSRVRFTLKKAITPDHREMPDPKVGQNSG